MLTTRATKANCATYRAYLQHKYDCKGKTDKAGQPVEMRLTYGQWLWLWLSSGKFHMRGTGHGRYCMARKNDLGHYEPGNVFIQLHTENQKDGVRGRSQTALHRARISLSKLRHHRAP